MATPPDRRPGAAKVTLPPPPPDPARLGRALFMAIAGVSGLGAVALASPALLALAVVSGGLGYLALVGRRQSVGASLALAALDRAARGRFDEARALLDAVPPRLLSSVVGQMVEAQRAALALYEGRLEEAVAHATRAAREGARVGLGGALQRDSARSIRAVALAALGREAEARADVTALRGAEVRQAAFLARAALAEAILCARARDLEGLARVLREERALLLGATGLRERLVARALSRMVAARSASVYREAGRRDDEDLDEQASWVARIAPEAAAYARAPRLGGALEAPVADATGAARRAEPRARRPVAALVACGVLVVGLMVVWSAIARRDAATGGARARPPVVPAAAGATLAVAGLLAHRARRARRLTRALARGTELRLRGELEPARAALEALTSERRAGVAPQAHRELAALALSRGDARAAIAHAEAGIRATRVSAGVLAHARPVVLPMLHGELAVAYAAAGRVARAEEELEHLRAHFPASPFLARDTLRARLIALAATGRLDDAAGLARARPVDLFLTAHEELLCDALRVHAGDALPEGERERVLLDVREGSAAGLLRLVAPTLVTDLTGPTRPRVAPAEASAPYSEPPASDDASVPPPLRVT